jgi:hypothetical protein
MAQGPLHWWHRVVVHSKQAIYHWSFMQNMYTCMYIHMYIHSKVHTYKYGTRKTGRTTDQHGPISDQELAVYGPFWCLHTKVLDNRWATDRHKLRRTGYPVTTDARADGSRDTQRAVATPYSIIPKTINTSTIHASVRQAYRKNDDPNKAVVRVLPCNEKPETGTQHHASKLQVEGLRLVVAEKGMQTNAKSAHGLVRGFVPLHLKAAAESVQSHASSVKKRPTTNARPLGNKLVMYCCTRLKATSFVATKLRIVIGKAQTNIVELRSYGPRQYWCRDLLMDADMLTRSVEENLKRKKLS